MSTTESRLRQKQQQDKIRKKLQNEAIRSQLAVQDAMKAAEEKSARVAKNLRNKQKEEQEKIRARLSEEELRKALERASKPFAPPTLHMSPFEQPVSSTFTPSFPQYGTATATSKLSSVPASSTSSTFSTSRPTSPSLSIPYSLDKSFGIGKYSSELSNETAEYLKSLRRPQPPSQPTSSRPVYSRPSSAPTARPAFTRSSSEPRIKFSNQPPRQEIIKNNFLKPICQVEILNVNLNQIFVEADKALQGTNLFEIRLPGREKYYKLISLLFVFDTNDRMEYEHDMIYYNRGSNDPNTSTTAIQQNRETFTPEMKERKDQQTNEIKISGNKLSSIRNSILVRLFFLFLIKVMFYAQKNVYFFDLERSIENNIIFCGNNIAIARGGKFYPNNFFLKNNVGITYSTSADIGVYLGKVKEQFYSYLLKLKVIESKTQFPKLRDLYKSLQPYRMERDKVLEMYLGFFDAFISGEIKNKFKF